MINKLTKPIKLNDIQNVELLLRDHKNNPSEHHNWAIRFSSSSGYIDIVKLLLNTPRVNPAYLTNWAIINAYNNKHNNVVQLLWKDKRVKTTLQKDKPELYEKLKKEEIQRKVKEFTI